MAGRSSVAPEDRFADGLDLVVSLGGDGTMLRAASLAERGGVPCSASTSASSAYLTEVEPTSRSRC